MSHLLFIVEDTFLIRGRGLVLAPGIPHSDQTRIRVGDPLQLKRPNGSTFETAIAGIEFLTPNPMRVTPILLTNLCKDDVPVGTEVWISE